MSLSQKLRSRLIKTLFSKRTQSMRRGFAEQRRRFTRRAHTVSAFLELDDPYSYLLSHYLAELEASYDVELHYYLAPSNKDEAYRPRTDMLAEYAEEDCRRMAAELGVPFLDRGRAPPVEHRRALIEALASEAGGDGFARELRDTLRLYWRGDSEGAARRVAGVDVSGKGEALLAENAARLAKLGHYNCATLHYGGEWYWGVDRVHHLLQRLDDLGATRADVSSASLASIQQATTYNLPVAKPGTARELPPLELFFSFRSPYSYLALQRVYATCDAFGLRLELRPVLPMVMRGMQVPRAKLLYIASDMHREARRLGVPFGNFVDPLGAGIERCMAAFQYAQSERRERDFVMNAMQGIWSQGIDVASDKGMRKVTGRSGLFWPDVVAAMSGNDWQDVVEQNREAMMDAGCWGVPTLRIGDFAAWGQDRVWLVARHIEDLCHTGDGILI